MDGERMELFEQVRAIMADCLQLGDRAQGLSLDAPLLGALPELDSHGVVHLITALEEQYGFVVDDDEISAETFASVASLVAFVASKAE